MAKIVVVGDANVDYVLDIDYYPELGSDTIVRSFRRQLGGSAALTAAYLARLSNGYYDVFLVSSIGYDEDSELVLEELRKHNVRVDYIHRLNIPTGKVFVIQADDERTMFSFRGANPYLMLEDYEVRKIVEDSILIHVSGYSLLENPQKSSVLRIVEEAWKKDITVSFDPGPLIVRENPDIVKGIYGMIKILLMNTDEARSLAGTHEFLEYFQSLSMDYNIIIVIKMGKEGAVSFYKGFSYWCTTVRVNYPINIVGAGDAFDAGFLIAYLKDYDISESLMIACRVAKERVKGRPLEELLWSNIIKSL